MTIIEKKIVVVTGGSGYIGSVISLFLMHQNYKVIIIDKNPLPAVLSLEAFKADNILYIASDFADSSVLSHIFSYHSVHAVIHCAAFIEAGESVVKPDYFYENNVIKTVQLLDTMKQYGILNFIFSSSAAVYGAPSIMPISEEQKEHPINPYGKSKHIIEMILADYAHAFGFRALSLRCFNVAGAWLEYNLGELHKPETHCIPALLQAAYTGKQFSLFGDCYTTHDGSCVRDFVHVQDVATATFLALKTINQIESHCAVNIASGNGHSVLDLISTVETITHRKIYTKNLPARAGDPPLLIGDINKAQQLLGWKPMLSSLQSIITTAHLFSSRSPALTINSFYRRQL